MKRIRDPFAWSNKYFSIILMLWIFYTCVYLLMAPFRASVIDLLLYLIHQSGLWDMYFFATLEWVQFLPFFHTIHKKRNHWKTSINHGLLRFIELKALTIIENTELGLGTLSVCDHLNCQVTYCFMTYCSLKTNSLKRNHFFVPLIKGVREYISKTIKWHAGVPQGFIWGPVLFSVLYLWMTWVKKSSRKTSLCWWPNHWCTSSINNTGSARASECMRA